MAKRKIAYISGTRADYGLMTSVFAAIEESKKLELKLYITGIHLMAMFGNTYKLVLKDFPRARKVPVVFGGDTSLDMAEFAGKYISKLTRVFSKDRPDVVLVLGDRIEMLATALSCVYLGIPIAHIHGGEKTYTVDEVARHAITKMAHIHLTATKKSAEVVKKLGEEGWRIHIVGAPALDTILHRNLPGRAVLSKYGLDRGERFVLVSFHPVSEQVSEAAKQVEELLGAVKFFKLPVLVVYPHADAGGKRIIKVIEKERKNPLFRIYPNIDYVDFLALEKEASVWVGNSSGAIIESPSFKTPVVNVGIRQLGRERAGNVIDVEADKQQIIFAIDKSLNDKKYLHSLGKVSNPWGDGKAAERIVHVLEGLEIGPKLLTKQITY